MNGDEKYISSCNLMYIHFHCTPANNANARDHNIIVQEIAIKSSLQSSLYMQNPPFIAA